MKTDARVRYTKMMIKNSFIELLKEKPVSKITVKEICERSEINRATFYKHYYDAYDLIERLEDEFLTELKESISAATSKNFRETFTLILVSLKAQKEMYQTIFSENGDRYFPYKVIMFCYDIVASEMTSTRLKTTEQQWLYYFLAHGCSGILNQWITNGMVEPINEIVAFADQLIQNNMKFQEK